MTRFRASVVGILLLILWAVPDRAMAETPPPLFLPISTVAHARAAPPPAASPPSAEQATPAASAGQSDRAHGNPSDSNAPDAQTSQADLNRIKQGLEELPTVRLDKQVTFFVNVEATGPRFMDLVGGFDLLHGPTPYAGMTHQEFMDMVRPKELFSSTGITATDMLQSALVNLMAQQIITRGLDAIHRARSEAEVRAIQARINKELAALNGGGS